MGNTYGFLGAGEITAAIVTGLSTDTASAPRIFLSPRGRQVARDLADRFTNVRVLDDNQAVLDETEHVVLALPASAAEEALTRLRFRTEHVVISAMAGVSLARLRAWTAPANRTVRSIPLPQASDRQSLTAMYPDDATARALFDLVGKVLVPEHETGFTALSATTATFAAQLDYLRTIADWLSEHGVDRATAHTYIASVFGNLGQSLLRHEDPLTTMSGKHMTPGGTNEQFSAELREQGMPDIVRNALEHIAHRLRD